MGKIKSKKAIFKTFQCESEKHTNQSIHSRRKVVAEPRPGGRGSRSEVQKVEIKRREGEKQKEQNRVYCTDLEYRNRMYGYSVHRSSTDKV